MSGIAATLLGTTARVAAHFRHGIRKTASSAGFSRSRSVTRR
jgi:hypothetical protein